MKIHFALVGFALLVSSLAGLAEESIFPIYRESPKQAPNLAPHLTEIVQENGLIMRTYKVPPTYVCGGGSLEERQKMVDAKMVLSEMGVDFSAPGSEAVFSPVTNILKVILPEIEHRIVASFIQGSTPGVEKQVAARIEVFELPSLDALDLMEQCDQIADHTSQRNKIVEMVKNEKASIASFYTAIDRSGNRTASQYGSHAEKGKDRWGFEMEMVKITVI